MQLLTRLDVCEAESELMIMTRKLLVLAFLLASVVAVAQDRDERSLGSFDKIRVGQGIKVYLKKSNTEKAVVEVRGIDLDEIVTDVRGSSLNIYIDRNRTGNHINVSVDLYYKSLTSIDVSSAAYIETSEPITGNFLEISVASAGSGDIEVNVESLEMDASSAGNLNVTGKAKTMEVTVNSAGSINANDLEAEDVTAKANTAGSLKVFATKRIDARANSAGSIRYRGNPDKEYTSTNSGGSIRRSGN